MRRSETEVSGPTPTIYSIFSIIYTYIYIYTRYRINPVQFKSSGRSVAVAAAVTAAAAAAARGSLRFRSERTPARYVCKYTRDETATIRTAL